MTFLQDAYDTIHDVMVDITGEIPDNATLQDIFQNLPAYIYYEANQYGWYDTEVREQIGLWVRSSL